MAAYLYPLYALAALGLSFWEAHLALQSHDLTLGLLLLVTLAMAYDSFAIALSPLLGDSSLLKRLNHLRFLLHDLATPLLIVVVMNLAKTAGLSWLDILPVQTVGWLLALVLIVTSLAQDALCHDLTPVSCAGTLRYRLKSFSPASSLITTVVVLLLGLGIWLVAGKPWLLLAGLAIVAANGVRGAGAKLLISPCAEMGLIGSVLMLVV